MIRDRDGIYGDHFRHRVGNMGIEGALTAPRSPWQDPNTERHGGSLRRECLDHVIVLGGSHLHRILKSYFAYYRRARTHLSLGKDLPSRGRFSLPAWVTSWRSPRSAASTIGTSAEPPNRRWHSPPSVRMARSVLSAIPRSIPRSPRLLAPVRRCRPQPVRREKVALRSPDGDLAKDRWPLRPSVHGIGASSLDRRGRVRTAR
jgi:hypothetical protein